MSTSCCHCVFLSMYSPLIVWIPEENDIQLIELLIMGIHLFRLEFVWYMNKHYASKTFICKSDCICVSRKVFLDNLMVYEIAKLK